MARSLIWKEKVVISTLVLSLFFFANATAQTTPSNSITYSCKAADLESVMEDLSKTSGYNFIYSRSMINVASPVTINVKDQRIEDILTLIERQADVSFKILDRHVIVKAVVKPTSIPEVEETKVVVKSTLPTITVETPLITSTARTIPATAVITSHTAKLASHLDNRIAELQRLLGPGVPRSIPPVYVSQINFDGRYKGWFASAATFASDKGMGIELQAGLRFMYAVYQPRWSSERGFHSAYGFGNSITLPSNFSFNPIYLYSGHTQSMQVYPFSSSPQVKHGPEFTYKETNRNHQVKLMMQYAVNKNFVVRAGPVLNYQVTITDLFPSGNTNYYEGTYQYRQAGYQDNTTVTYHNGQFVSGSPTARVIQSWIGWETAFAYRINFSRTR